ncbi:MULTISPECIES: hypothetical protein [Pseudomonas]|uniref:Uncharacterized protein n=1 Tax=Pseudomonas putida TaxID=303 RepID=A0A379KS46_PSEPU|nr:MULTISPECIES: hypothetical protein [Pseudomonas]MBM7395540.1 hypothetical protein [Pseudomonas sp. M5]MBG6123589.1 hypothetical protein [Pseudomonas sp. M2]NSX20329.1 hypothetical protein [Pseudomonas putida]SUD70315.1 Uncharacterised protein [Pseudomonas putida]HDS1744511.1 hypothetical protein [Pseudomonas putida]
MLKIVPDPPHNPHSLEDALMMAADYALCAEVVALQAQHWPKYRNRPTRRRCINPRHDLPGLALSRASSLAQHRP